MVSPIVRMGGDSRESTMNGQVMIGLLVLAGVSLLGNGPARPQERPPQADSSMA